MNIHLKRLHLRLKRAIKHLDSFERQAKRFCKSIPYDVVTEKDFDGVNNIVRYKLNGGKEPPLRLSLIAGDCIHNLRSVIDNVVWQLGSLTGCPKRELDNLSFPICLSGAEFIQKKKSLKCLPQVAIDLIESLQPYQRKDDPKLHPLYILNRLWNDDKHRSPVLMLTIHGGTQITPRYPTQIITLQNGRSYNVFMARGITIHTGGKAEDGKEIATVTLRAGEPEPQFDSKVVFKVAFDERGPAKGKVASKSLRNLHDFVRDEVLAKFEPIFPK